MGLTEFKAEFLHPKSPEYILTAFFEKMCHKDNIKGLTEEDIIEFVVLLWLSNSAERAKLAFKIFDIKNEGSSIPVANFYRFGN